jgi:hypothetical protein
MLGLVKSTTPEFYLSDLEFILPSGKCFENSGLKPYAVSSLPDYFVESATIATHKSNFLD